MKFVFPIAALLACVFFFLYLPVFDDYCTVIDMDYHQYRLDKALELSSRAATSNGLEHGLVTLDRSELQEAEFNTGVILDTYAQFMCFNYNLIPTEYNKEMMLNRSVLMAVGGRGFAVTQNEYGDYYMSSDGGTQRIKGALNPTLGYTEANVSANTGTRTLFGVYTPFVVEDGIPPAGFERYASGSLLPNAKTFAVMLKDKVTGKLNVYSSESLPGDITPSRVQHEALSQMSRAFTQAWYQLNIKNATQERLTLPATLTNFGVSSAANPGLLVLVEGFDINTSKLLRSEAFTGYKAVVRREVVAYTQVLNGVTSHWYSYRDQLDMDKALVGAAPYTGVTVDYVYPDLQSAATALIEICAGHNVSQKYTCLDDAGNPTVPHCHYQPNLAFLMK